MTTAWSTAPAIYVQGEAHSPKEARLLNAIMVTIRFASPRPWGRLTTVHSRLASARSWRGAAAAWKGSDLSCLRPPQAAA